jgi:crotonobetainyl-CoA:carnitine CoA-transferase CaiB-like acyl-CoA transferase
VTSADEVGVLGATQHVPGNHANGGARLLEDVRVLSFTQFYMGPVAAQYLADMGADVIKIEVPGRGAWERSWSPGDVWPGGVSLLLALGTRNVRSLSLNLKHQKARDVMTRLVNSADVMVHNFRPGVMERLGFDYESLKAINPRLIYAYGSGYGTGHRYSDLPGQDLLLQGLSGLAAITGPADRAPTPTGAPIVDAHGGTLLALGMLAALHYQRRTGIGQKVEVPMLQAALDLQAEPLMTHLNGGNLEKSNRPLASPQGRAPSGIYPTRDGFIAITGSSPSSLADMSTVMGDPPALAPYVAPEANTFEAREAIYDALASCTQMYDTEDLINRLRGANVWCAPALGYTDMLEDPVVREVAPVSTARHPRAGDLQLLRHPIRYSSGDPEVRSVAPDPGEHTDAILRQLGYTDEDISALRADSVI